MSALLSRLVDSLRHELQQLGEMLVLLEAQHDVAGQRSPEFIEPSITAVELQRGRVETARARRRLLEEQFAHALHQAPDVPFVELLPLVPDEYRPLIEALLQENALCLQRIRERAEQNHRLLRRCADGMQRFITSLSPWMASPSLEAELQTKTTPPHTPAAHSCATVA